MEQRLTEIERSLGLSQCMTDERILRSLSDLPFERAMKVLDDFENNLKQNRAGIRNPAGYLVGMVGRTKKMAERPPMPGAVLHEIEGMFRSGHLRREDVDARCMDMLQQLPEEGAMRALGELRAVDVHTVKNMSALFMSVMKKYTPQGQGHGHGQGQGHGGPGHFNPPGGPGGRPDWENEHSHYPPRRPEGGMDRGRDRDVAATHRDERPQGHFEPPMAHGTGGDLPAPKVMPAELLYGFGADEYVPEMPRVGFVQANLEKLSFP
jgi:hypothetical protein